MKISIISIGKFDNSPHKHVFETYVKRLKWKIDLKELDVKNSQNLSVEKLREGEGALILKALRAFIADVIGVVTFASGLDNFIFFSITSYPAATVPEVHP